MFRAHCALNSNQIPCLVTGFLVTGCTGCIQANNTLYLLLMVIGHLEIFRLLCYLRSMYVYFHVLTEPEATRESGSTWLYGPHGVGGIGGTWRTNMMRRFAHYQLGKGYYRSTRT